MSKISEALEAWRQAVRELEATTPGAAEWWRARLVEMDRRAAYQTAAADSRRPPDGSTGPIASSSQELLPEANVE